MKKSGLLHIALLISIMVTSCGKGLLKPDKTDIITELSKEEFIVSVNNSNYVRETTESLYNVDDDSPYFQGVIEYKEQGNVMAIIDFSQAGDNKAKYIGKGGDKNVDLKKEGGGYKKVIIEPLVKADDCDYIIAGIIKFYDSKSGKWVATFDYGDGTCDDIITKITHDGTTNFSMNDYPEWK